MDKIVHEYERSKEGRRQPVLLPPDLILEAVWRQVLQYVSEERGGGGVIILVKLSQIFNIIPNLTAGEGGAKKAYRSILFTIYKKGLGG